MEIPKRKFKFVAFDGIADIYANGQKIRAHHDAKKGHVYFHIASDQVVEVEAAPHDPRIPIEVEVKDGKVVPVEIERPVRPRPVVSEKPKVVVSEKPKQVVSEAVAREDYAKK